MKTLIKYPSRLIIFTILSCIASLPLISQQNDLVIMASGEIKQGKVTAMEESAVKFVHAGEDLEYSLKKTEIAKIQFSSGRVQTFNDHAQPAPTSDTKVLESTASPAERKGKLAVIPVEVISNDPGINPEIMGTQIQHEAVNSFKKHSPGISVQDPRTTTAILLKHGMDHTRIAAMAPAEVAEILGVEYVAYGVVNIENEGTMTTGSSSTTYKDKEASLYSSGESQKLNKGSETSSVYANTTVNYDCKVELSIYNDQGSNVYSDSRDAFGLSQDSYNNGLNYMIRRTPFGDKHK